MRPTLRPCLTILFAVLTVVAAVVLPAHSACQVEQVRVTLVVILANDRDNKVDAMLTCLAQEVRKKRPDLTGFKEINQTCKSVAVGKDETFELVENQNGVVSVRHGADAKNRVCLKVKAPGAGEITYSTACGKFFPIITRYQTKKNETLILAIRVEPCKK